MSKLRVDDVQKSKIERSRKKGDRERAITLRNATAPLCGSVVVFRGRTWLPDFDYQYPVYPTSTDGFS